MFRFEYGGLLSSMSEGTEHPPRGTSIVAGMVMVIGTLDTYTVYLVREV